METRGKTLEGHLPQSLLLLQPARGVGLRAASVVARRAASCPPNQRHCFTALPERALELLSLRNTTFIIGVVWLRRVTLRSTDY